VSATTPVDLAWYLDGAVRLEIARMAGDDWNHAIRAKVARQARARITDLTGGAELLFGGRACITEYANLATALAALAYQPGGVTALGRHWCTNHQQCEFAASVIGDDQLLSTNEVAALAGISRRHVAAWCQMRHITAVRTPGGHLRYRASLVLPVAKAYRAHARTVALADQLGISVAAARRLETALVNRKDR